MFSGTRPGQRESSTKSPITEITITLKQAAWASMILPLVGFIVYRAAIVPASRGIQELTPRGDAVLIWATQKLGALLVIGGFVLPYLAAGISFLIQVLDQNWPPPRSARSGERGPAMPWSGEGEPVIMEPYEGLPSVPDIKQHSVQADLMLHQGKTTYAAKPDMTIAEWDRLAAMFSAGHYSVSVRDLEQYGKFSKGREGSARRVNHQICDWTGLTEKGKRGKRLAVEVFRQWVTDAKYREGMPPGALPHPSPTVRSV